MGDYLQWLRGQVGRALLPLVYATAIIEDEAGRVLFQRRADFGDAWWGLPGGLLHPGETLEACARREVWEETGLRVHPLRLTGVYSSPRYAVTYPNGDRVQQVTFCFACQVEGGTLRPEAGEIQALEFFAPGAWPKRPLWYADMLDHHERRGAAAPYFDPPEFAPLETPYPTLPRLRQRVGSAPLLWPGASAAVWDETGRLLLQRQRSDNQWHLPGGALDTGESLAQTAVRETREETGLDVEVLHLAGIFAGQNRELANGDQLWLVGALFACRQVRGELRPDGVESAEARFFARDALPPLGPLAQARVAAAFAGAAV